MQDTHSPITPHDYAKCIEVSKRVRWDIDMVFYPFSCIKKSEVMR